MMRLWMRGVALLLVVLDDDVEVDELEVESLYWGLTWNWCL